MKPGFLLTVLLIVFSALPFGGTSFAQSASQDFPTPIISNEIAGTINARDVGDSRVTTYYYTFNGEQGDLFINIVTKNFTGDLDIFAAAGLRTITKIVIFANDTENETGRAVYFRKPEKLLLRIQGRSPNDDPASFRLKFAGSFVAVKESDLTPEPEMPKVNTGNVSGNRVNSVGTLLPPLPRLVPTETADARSNDAEDSDAAAISGEPAAKTPSTSKGLEIIVTDKAASEDKPATPVRRTSPPRRRRTPVKIVAPKQNEDTVATENANAETPIVKNVPARRPPKRVKAPKVITPDPLASIRLVVAFKDGKLLEKSMSEVFKFSVDKGILTVILKDGSITRYPIIDVAKVTIE